ncbi:competence protein CoiA [Pradoshia sp.]
MLIAANQDGELIHSTRAANRLGEEFRCPVCRKRVLYKAGSKRIPHFAHQREANCPGTDEPESIIHLEGKNLLYKWTAQWAEESALEKYYEPISQRTDIEVYAEGKHYAIEFQCSPISAQRLIERTLGYQKIEMEPVWIFHTGFLKKQGNCLWSLTSSLQTAIRHSPNGSSYLLFFDCKTPKTIIQLNNLIPITKTLFFAQMERVPLTVNSVEQILYPKARPIVFIREWMRKRESLIRNEWRYQGITNPLFRSLYSIGIQGMLPMLIGIPLKSSIFFATAPHHWQGLIVIDLLDCQEKLGEITRHGIQKRFMDRLRKREILVRSLPCVPGSFFAPVEEFLRFLEKAEYLIKIGENSYIIEEGFPVKMMQQEEIIHSLADFLKRENEDS